MPPGRGFLRRPSATQIGISELTKFMQNFSSLMTQGTEENARESSSEDGDEAEDVVEVEEVELVEVEEDGEDGQEGQSVDTVDEGRMNLPGDLADIVPPTSTPKNHKFRKITNKVITAQGLFPPLKTVVDGEETQQIWPITSAWFLGPKAENEELLKRLITKVIDHHSEFRKYRYFPLDPEYVTDKMKEHVHFRNAEEKLWEELEGLSERLKNSVPFFSFRSQGHMLWDTTIASNVGYIAALLYNQNNVASMASGVTLQLEREASLELCRMVGYNVLNDESEHRTERPGAWGHLPNGGTVANLEAMWAARCLKFNGLVLQKMLQEKFTSGVLADIRNTFTYKNLKGLAVLLKDASVWELLNIPVDEAIDMFDNLHKAITAQGEEMSLDDLFSLVKEYTMEEVGVWEFFSCFEEEFRREGVKQAGRWFVPGSRHYSWDKGNNILGMGRRNLVKVSVDLYCRMNIEKLEEYLEECLEKKIPVVGVTAVFGTTQEGAVDNLKRILELRDDLAERGLTFYIHVDGAWGGYFASILRTMNGERSKLYDDSFNGKPVIKRLLSNSTTEVFHDSKLSSHFVTQLKCLELSNSITLDPHKSGFCPYPAGGLLYRNGNIRKFLAQKAAYVHHGSKNNEEINLFGVDGSKPGAASAGVWLSHKVIGLHEDGYGLLLKQCTFSAGVMYAMWVSMERPEDPFRIIPAIPLKEGEKKKWNEKRIRKEIIESENQALVQNSEALKFLQENGPDTLINCLSANFRTWDNKRNEWVLNNSLEKQREFMDKFYKRCSHSIEKPSMVDRGIQIILNSTTWEKDTHCDAYTAMKKNLGLNENDEGKIKMIINTCMSPWFRAHKTFKRVSGIIRNELYNAYGAITDEPVNLEFVSPCSIDTVVNWKQDGNIFAEMEASFSVSSKCYHAIAMFMVNTGDRENLMTAARQAAHKLKQERSGCAKSVKYLPLRFRTKNKIKLFDLMTEQDENFVAPPQETQKRSHSVRGKNGGNRLSDKLAVYGDKDIHYNELAMPEVDVEFYYIPGHCVSAKIKLKRVIRFQHLARDFVDEEDYPPTQEYLLYSHKKKAYLSHVPNRFPDFQQLIALDEVPEPFKSKDDKEKSVLYQEALSRGVVVYLPQILTGGAPVLRRGGRETDQKVCQDPLKLHTYNAISWSDQGAFTGEMASISIKFASEGKRWFDGRNINAGYDRANFPQYYEPGGRRRYREEVREEEEEEEEDSYTWPNTNTLQHGSSPDESDSPSCINSNSKVGKTETYV